MQSAINAVKSSLPTSLVTSSVPTLSPGVKKQHIEAGTLLVRLWEKARVAQSKKHEELVKEATRVGRQMKEVERKSVAYKKLDSEMDELALLLVAMDAAVRKTEEEVLKVLDRLPALEKILTDHERKRAAQKVLDWNQKAAESLTTEMEEIEREYQERFHSALQAAFEEQLARYRQSGGQDESLFVARHNARKIRLEDVSLVTDAKDDELLDQFFAEETGEEK